MKVNNINDSFINMLSNYLKQPKDSIEFKSFERIYTDEIYIIINGYETKEYYIKKLGDDYYALRKDWGFSGYTQIFFFNNYLKFLNKEDKFIFVSSISRIDNLFLLWFNYHIIMNINNKIKYKNYYYKNKYFRIDNYKYISRNKYKNRLKQQLNIIIYNYNNLNLLI